jgi:release factor glutamine methyltransferase
MRQKIAIAGLNLLHKIKKKVLITVFDKKLYLYPRVFDPRHIFTTKFFIKNLSVKVTDKVLDIGTGTGVLAIFAAEKARRVIAADINPFAVKCAKENVKLNKLGSKVKIIKSDLFSNVKGKFDLILFNPPYLRGKPKRQIEYAWYDPKNKVIKNFLEQAKKHLNKNGKIFLLYSTIADKKKLESLIRKKGYKFKIVAKKYGLFEKFFIYEISLP